MSVCTKTTSYCQVHSLIFGYLTELLQLQMLKAIAWMNLRLFMVCLTNTSVLHTI
jgi:hypothetical protein